MRARTFAAALLIIAPILIAGCLGGDTKPRPKNQGPVADFWFNGTKVTNQPILFDAGPSTDDKGIDSYLWQFGDTFTDTGQRVFHTYSAQGDYHVILTVKDMEGCEGAIGKVVHVDAEASITKATARLVVTGYIVKTEYAEVNVTVRNNGGPQPSGALRVLAEELDHYGTVFTSGEQQNNDSVNPGASLFFQFRLSVPAEWNSMSFRTTLFLNNTQVDVRTFGWNG